MYSSITSSFIIPDSVISIGDWAFSNSYGLTSIIIPNSVTSIGKRAFSNCNSLTSIIIPNSVTSIGEWAFGSCSRLTSITIPASVNNIGNGAFGDCGGLTSINVDSSNEYYSSIGGVLFNKSANLIIKYPGGKSDSSYIIPDSVTSIGDSAFYNSGHLMNVTIPSSITSIGNGGFANCGSLTSVTIPNSVTSIGSEAFLSCGDLTSVNIPGSVASISNGTFRFCYNLKSLTIGEGVTSIDHDAFYHCRNLISVTIPNSVTSIDAYAFDSCINLTSLTIGNGVTSINSNAFSNCTSLTQVQFLGNAPNMDSSVFYKCSSNLILYYLCGKTGFTNPWYRYQTLKIGIDVTTPPTKIDYVVGQSLDLTGLVVTGFYYGGTSGIIPISMLDINGFDSSAPIKGQVVTVATNGRTATFIVDIYAKTYTVTFNSNGGSDISNQTVNYDSKVSIPDFPNKTGYTFGGWYKNVECISQWDYTTDKVTTDTTLFAKWSINSYTVTFDSQGGSTVSNSFTNYNSAITAPTAPTKTGYTFGGWYKEAGCTNAWNFATDVVTTNTTLYAKWTVNSYTVIFDSQGGSNVASKTADYNTTITAPITPTKTGYTFGGWYKEASCTNSWNFATDKATSDITLYAKWILNPRVPLTLKSVSSGYNSITTTWGAVTGASGYELYRSTSATGIYSFVATATATSFNNTALATGTTYYYKVRAYVLSGTTKAYGSFTAVVSAKPIPTTPSVFVVVSAGYNSIKASWWAVTGASGYELYRTTSSTGVYSLVSRNTAISYNNTSLTTNTTYYYKVRVYRLVGTTKVYGNFTSIKSAKPIPRIPVNLSAVRTSSTSIKLSWSGVTGASGYQVYRATNSNGTYSLIKSTSSIYYSNTGLKTGTTYYYKVRAYRLVGSLKVYSGWTVIKSTRP